MRLFREPLFQFLIAGALLFGGHEWWTRGTRTSPTEGSVRIGQGEVRWLRETFANQWRRDPTGEEMDGLIATLVEEELLAREARALGLDQNDTIVRRRLAQKVTFLVEDTSRIADPGEEELRRFYEAHAERYRTEPKVSFSHVFFSRERHPHADADARAMLTMVAAAGLQGVKPPEGDPLPLEDAFVDVDFQAVSGLFGPEFARAVFALPPGPWSGPVVSAFGVHLVRVTRLRQAEPRRLEDVRDAVVTDWRRQREIETKAAYVAKLRDKYGVVVDDDARSIPGRVPNSRVSP